MSVAAQAALAAGGTTTPLLFCGDLLDGESAVTAGLLRKMAGQAGWRREGRAATQYSAIIDEAARVVRGRGSATWGRSGAGRGGTHSYYRDWPFDWR